jgi:hypothetical protein
MKRKIILSGLVQVFFAFLFIQFTLSTYGQRNKFSTDTLDYQFVNYLIDGKNYNEALFLINRYLESVSGNNFGDTANYLKGMINYRQKELIKSSDFLFQVTPGSEFYYVSRFLAGYELAYLSMYKESRKAFETIKTEDSLLASLKTFQLASLSLLENKLDAYRAYSKNTPINYFQLHEQKNKLDELYIRATDFKPKSPLLAGTLSTIIPGAGKMYTGKIGEGVTALLGTAILGAITYENYKKAGISNYKTITFGSLFGIFYISNIYGSIISVKVYRNEFYKSLHHAILFNMHIPIRNVFRSNFK